MPIYEYVCNACGHEFEEWQKITDVPVQKCPTCGKRKVERLVSLSAFHLKGTGWYVTDYAKKSGTEGSGSKSKKPSKSGEPAKAEASSSSTSSSSTDTAGSDSSKKKD